MRRSFAAALALTSSLVGFSQVGFAQSLNDELSNLLATHPAVMADRENLAATEAFIDVTKSEFLPTLSFYGDTGGEAVDSRTRRISGLDTSNLRRDKFTFTLTQNLYRGNSDENRLAAAQAANESAEGLLRNTVREEMLRGIIAYIDVLKFSSMVQLSKDREATITEQMNLENERVERGSGIAVDVLEAKSRLRKAKEKTVSNIQDLEIAEAVFERAFGHKPNLIEMKDVMPPTDILPTSLVEAVEFALTKRGSIQSFANSKKSQELLTEAEKGAYYPSIDLVGSYDYEDNVSATRGITKTASVLLQANWEIFSGFETRARVTEAARISGYYDGVTRNERRKAEQEVTEAWSELNRSRERYDLIQSAVNIAEEVFEARQKLRDSGKETAINLLDAESQVYDSRISLIEMDYVSRAAVYRVLSAAGLLTPENLGIQ